MGIRKRRSRAEQTAHNRTRLLEAARTVFLRHGYHGATLDQVAQAAGLTKGAVYARFASKADLFLALVEERVAQRAQDLAELPLPTPGEGGADPLLRQWLERVRADRPWALLVIEFRVAAARDPQLNARYAALHERVLRGVAAAVERAAAALPAELAASPLELARIGMALANGMLLEHVADPAAASEALAMRANAALFDAFATRPAVRTARRRTG